MQKNSTVAPNSALVAAAVLISASSVLIGNFATDRSPAVVSGAGFFVSIIVFWTIRSRHRRPAWTSETFRLVAAANVLTSAVFLAFFFSLKYLEPSLASSVQTGSAPLAAVIASAVGISTTRFSRRQSIPVLVIAAGVTLTVVTAMTGLSGLPLDSTGGALFGVALAVVSGSSTLALTVVLKRLSNAGWSNLEVLRYRFGLIVIVSTALSVGQPIGDVGAVEVAAFVAVALIVITLPMYLLQFAISRAAVLTVVVFINLVPATTFALQLLDPRLAVSVASAVATALTCAGIISYAVAARRVPTNSPSHT